MQEAVKICQEHRGGELLWGVDVKNTLAYDFYKRIGAEQVQDLFYMFLSV
jgi:hypothetical protein